LRRSLIAVAMTALFAIGSAVNAQTAPSPASPVNYSPMKWGDLAPGGWDIQTIYRRFDLASLRDLDDADPRAGKILHELRTALDTAPADPELDGRPVKLHGFAVVLKGTPDAMREFLLVAWQGGCIHTPPPAANQQVRVVAAEPVRGIDINYPIYVWGKLKVQSARTPYGKTGYTLTFDRFEPYPWQTARRAEW
jgi:uncharacterized protein